MYWIHQMSGGISPTLAQVGEGINAATIGMIVCGIVAAAVVIGLGLMAAASKLLRKVPQGNAMLVIGKKVDVVFSRAWVYPFFHRVEFMDISVKRIEIKRRGAEGLVCKDNMRADVEVAFFVRVNNTEQDVLKVAQSLGCERASDQQALRELFDAKFSEALKTVGKHFDFSELYTSRVEFKDEILKVIGTDLNGYVLEDAAIDYLEQTAVESMNPNNILDAEGIKKITELTAKQAVLANNIDRDKEKTIRKQDVEAREAILELDRQQAEAEEKQKREVATYKAREEAEARKISHEERLKAERARISTDEEVAVAEENKQRQIIVAAKNRERTDRIETERVEKDRLLEVTERERVVSLATIDKDKAVEVEKKNIQDVIRERVMVERTVAEEEEKIKDTHELMTAERDRKKVIIAAEAHAEEDKVKEVKKAEASKAAAQFASDELVIEAEARRASAEKDAAGKKLMAEAQAAEEAAIGMAQAQVEEARAASLMKFGTTEADVSRKKAEAEADGIKAKAEAGHRQGEVEAEVLQLKLVAEANGIREKAEAMKVLDGVGKEHEEFKLRLEKEKAVELEAIRVQATIAEHQAGVLGEALKSASIEIIGGETTIFDKLTNAVGDAKRVDRLVNHSDVLRNVNNTFFGDDADGDFKDRLSGFLGQFGIENTDDVRNLSIAALLGKLMQETDDNSVTNQLKGLLGAARSAGIADESLDSLGVDLPGKAKGKSPKKGGLS